MTRPRLPALEADSLHRRLTDILNQVRAVGDNSDWLAAAIIDKREDEIPGCFSALHDSIRHLYGLVHAAVKNAPPEQSE